jgi:hypothetical protein
VFYSQTVTTVEPIITLPYSEWFVAQHLARAFPTRDGYSLYAPLSRQEKAVDLLLTRRAKGVSRVATLQIKYSRAYEKLPNAQFKFETFFRSFAVAEQADFYILATLYPNITGRGGGAKSSWWLPLLLLFSRQEMAELISSLRTRRGAVDRMFYFAFDDPPARIVQTRGAVQPRDVTSFNFSSRLEVLRQFLSSA